MTTDRLSRSSARKPGVSGFTSAEWAQMARDAGNRKLADAWEQAEREGWDEQHFSQTRRDELIDKEPGAFGPNRKYPIIPTISWRQSDAA